MKVIARALITFAAISIASQAAASVITGVILPTNNGATYSSIAVDPITGKAYQTMDYAHTNINKFDNVAAMEAHTVATNITPIHSGTYFAAHNGSLYMRTGGSESRQISKVSAATGAVEASATVTGGMGGVNSRDTFDWGGYSGINAMSDSTNLYVVGGIDGSNKWGIATFDYALNQQKSVSFDLLNGRAGYAFAINGYVFFGDSFNSLHISRRVDAATGTVQEVDFTLAGLTPTSISYITGVTYDTLHDTLYVASRGGTVGKAGNLAAQLDVERSEVPEPSSMALLGFGLLAFAGVMRRRKSHG